MDERNFKPEDFNIETLGDARLESPLLSHKQLFVDDASRLTFFVHLNQIREMAAAGREIPSFELAGPRCELFFDPKNVNCGIVTCGGLCPGINDVIRAIVYEAYGEYGIQKVYGFKNGYKGLVRASGSRPLLLDTDMVNDIHEKGGTILGSSRGQQNSADIVDTLEELRISILFAIGGDGTLRGAGDIAAEARRRGAAISVIGIPKTIDNDILFVDKTFGFETAVEESRAVIQSAHIESKGTENGIGLVKLMGRDSGFIAAQATLANADVNFCLVPEAPFELHGESGLLAMMEKRLLRRGHAVVVVAEGAGQNLIDRERRKDASGNVLHEDIGVFLKERISDYFSAKGIPFSVKYIDPSYIIRSRPANANDSLFCLQMGQNAVHAGMSGRTGMMIGYSNNHYTHVPLKTATMERKKINPAGRLWQTVLSVTEQGKKGADR